MHKIEDCHVALPFIVSFQCLLLHLFVHSNKVLCSHLRGGQDVYSGGTNKTRKKKRRPDDEETRF